MSNIEWTEQTWNPIAGCSMVSPGCTNCYAMNVAHRFKGNQKFEGLTHIEGGRAKWTGKLNFDEKALLKPLKRKKPTTYFVNSMSDLFHEDAPDEWLDKVFAVMTLTPHHTYQVLTKRPERMREYVVQAQPQVWDAKTRIPHRWVIRVGSPPLTWPLPNVWLGVSAENQENANKRIPVLLDTPAAVRFVSAEPLLGSIDLGWIRYQLDDLEICHDSLNGVVDVQNSVSRDAVQTKEDGVPALDWIIAGGESGSGARLCEVEWIRSIVEQCKAAGVPCFVKQLGARPLANAPELEYASELPGAPTKHTVVLNDRKGGEPTEWPEDLRVRQMPEVQA